MLTILENSRKLGQGSWRFNESLLSSFKIDFSIRCHLIVERKLISFLEYTGLNHRGLTFMTYSFFQRYNSHIVSYSCMIRCAFEGTHIESIIFSLRVLEKIKLCDASQYSLLTVNCNSIQDTVVIVDSTTVTAPLGIILGQCMSMRWHAHLPFCVLENADKVVQISTSKNIKKGLGNRSKVQRECLVGRGIKFNPGIPWSTSTSQLDPCTPNS